MRNPLAVPWIGQGKAFFGRQELTSSGRQQFVDRSNVNTRFAAGRDQGIGLTGSTEAKTSNTTWASTTATASINQPMTTRTT